MAVDSGSSFLLSVFAAGSERGCTLPEASDMQFADASRLRWAKCDPQQPQRTFLFSLKQIWSIRVTTCGPISIWGANSCCSPFAGLVSYFETGERDVSKTRND